MSGYGGNDMRCYNGCPDDALRAKLAADDAATKRLQATVNALRKLHVDARCTYFPMEQKYLVFVGYQAIGEMEDSKQGACNKAIELLSSGVLDVGYV